MVLEKPKYIQNTFAIIFPKQATIRRKANVLEDRMKGKYFQPQIIPVPDNLDSEVPRLIYGSEHGFSQIVVSQVSITLNVSYSPDWQIDISKGKTYVLERVDLLFDIYPEISNESPYYCGLSTKVHLPVVGKEEEIFGLLHKSLGVTKQDDELFDFIARKTTVVEGRYFGNVGIGNYRRWKLDDADLNVTALPRKDVIEQGIEISADFNDRYSFSEDKTYRTSRDQAKVVTEKGLTEVIKLVDGVTK